MIKIEVTNPNGDHKLFNEYQEFCFYINNIENMKASDSNKKWGFFRYKYETLRFLYKRNLFLTLKEQEAIEKKRGLIEILKGDRDHVTQILFSRHFDIEPLRRDWCYEYCLEHGLKLSEWVKSEDSVA